MPLQLPALKSRRLPQSPQSSAFQSNTGCCCPNFDEVGYEAATTEMIAVRANTSLVLCTASDKSAILYALVKHNRCVSCLLKHSVQCSSASSFGSQIHAIDAFLQTQPVTGLSSHNSSDLQALDKQR